VIADLGRTSVDDRVGARLDAAVSSLGFAEERATIQSAYRLLCSESLEHPAGWTSRLNADGTPMQLGLSLGAAGASLQLVADPGPRLAADALARVAELLAVSGELPRIRRLVAELAPPDPLAHEAGAVWIGAAFARGRSPRLKVYVNAKWGAAEARWQRLGAFAAAGEWKAARERVGELEPLGVSLTVAADADPAARIYLSGYGRSFGYYEHLASAFSGPDFAKILSRYGRTVLGDDFGYPTRSAVWSLGIDGGSTADCKLELCGHCALESDLVARARCVEWLREAGVSPAPYLAVLEAVSGGRLGAAAATVHAYLGAGARRGHAYSTFYFNPATGLP
jgi:hypothetical protein